MSQASNRYLLHVKVKVQTMLIIGFMKLKKWVIHSNELHVHFTQNGVNVYETSIHLPLHVSLQSRQWEGWRV